MGFKTIWLDEMTWRENWSLIARLTITFQLGKKRKNQKRTEELPVSWEENQDDICKTDCEDTHCKPRETAENNFYRWRWNTVKIFKRID